MGTATVLVVDDERKIRDTVRAFLERSRYAVLTADTGEQALDVASRLRPDLVVLDLMLPDLPGEEVARSLRAISPVPIIMLIAKAGETDRVAGLRLGPDDYAVKPFSPLELVARVEAVLRRARPGGTDMKQKRRTVLPGSGLAGISVALATADGNAYLWDAATRTTPPSAQSSTRTPTTLPQRSTASHDLPGYRLPRQPGSQGASPRRSSRPGRHEAKAVKTPRPATAAARTST